MRFVCGVLFVFVVVVLVVVHTGYPGRDMRVLARRVRPRILHGAAGGAERLAAGEDAGGVLACRRGAHDDEANVSDKIAPLLFT